MIGDWSPEDLSDRSAYGREVERLKKRVAELAALTKCVSCPDDKPGGLGHAILCRECVGELGAELEAAQQHVAELKSANERLRKAGRYVTTCLCAASGKGGWSRAQVFGLFDYVCKRWPELDPRKAAEAAKGE